MNYAKDGSGLYSGEGKGAGIFLNCEDDCQNTVINSEFYDNKAENSGGGIQWLHDQPVLADLYFKNNTALYGNDIASFPVDLKIISEARLLSDIINAPGQLSAPIIIKVIDHYNQTVFNDNLSECQLISTNLNYTLMGNTKTQAKSGVYNFSEITFLGEPDSKVSISASSSVISSISNNVGLVNIYLRSCLLGEEQTTNSCNICQAGFYNLDPGSSCVPCPTGAVCEGRNIMFPKAGYWRPSNSTDLFFKCPNENSCLSGDINNLIGICDKGYYGNMCQICEHGYSRTSEHYCSKCPSKISNTFILITVVLVSIMIVVIITRASIKAASKSNSLVSVYFKIFLNYLQIVVLTASFNLDWPSLVLQFFYIQQQAGSMTDQLFSIDCYLGENNLKPYFTKLIFIGILPLFLGLITCIFWICYYRITKESKNIRNKFIGSLVVQLFLIHSSLVKFNFSMFDCAEILPGEYWLKSDMSVQCWAGDHAIVSVAVAFPSILIWCIATPSLCL